jgi:hypothetical protein
MANHTACTMQLRSLAKLACVVLLMQIVLLPSATARWRRAPPAPVVRLDAINLTHTTQIYTTGCVPGTVNLTLGTQRTTPVPYNLFASSSRAQRHHDKGPQLPAVYFLNGINVPASYYSDLATLLAASGFLVATSEYRRDTAFTLTDISITCKPYVITSAATLNTLMDAPAAGAAAAEGSAGGRGLRWGSELVRQLASRGWNLQQMYSVPAGYGLHARRLVGAEQMGRMWGTERGGMCGAHVLRFLSSAH